MSNVGHGLLINFDWKHEARVGMPNDWEALVAELRGCAFAQSRLIVRLFNLTLPTVLNVPFVKDIRHACEENINPTLEAIDIYFHPSRKRKRDECLMRGLCYRLCHS